MAYAKQTWADGEVGATPLSAARLNHMEDGIAAALPKAGGTMTGELKLGSSRILSSGTTWIAETANSTERLLIGSAAGAIDGKLVVATESAGRPALVLRAFAGQTANIFAAQNSAGSARVQIGPLTDGTAALYIPSPIGGISALLESGSIGAIPLRLKGAAGQTANLFEAQNSSGTVVGYIGAAGVASFNYYKGWGTLGYRFNSADDSKNLVIISDAGSVQVVQEKGISLGSTANAADIVAYRPVLTLSNTSAPPTAGSAGTIFVENGALKFRGGSGTITTLANA